MTEVVAALIWDKDRFMICQRPAHKTRGLLWEFVGGKDIHSVGFFRCLQRYCVLCSSCSRCLPTATN